MKNALIDIINQYKAEEICWYPSAGLDIDNIKLWFDEHGNKLKPSLFIFSDNEYNIDTTTQNITLNYDHERPLFFHALKHELLQVDELENLNNPSKYISEMGDHLASSYPELYLAYLKNKLTPENEVENGIDSKFIETLMDFGFIEETNDKTEFYKTYINNIDSAKAVDIYEKYFPTPNGLKIEYNNVTIVFIRSQNYKLFDFFRTNNFTISCLMCKRGIDNWLTNEFNHETISIKEAIGSKNYLPESITNQFSHYQAAFDWNSIFGNDKNNFVWHSA